MHTEWLTQWHSKMIASGLKRHPSLHLFQVTIFTINYFGSTQKHIQPQSSAPIVIIRRFQNIYMNPLLLVYEVCQ